MAMTEPNPAKVHAAFETLLEEIDAEIDIVSQSGAKAFADRDYDRARTVLDRAGQLTGFRDKVVTLRAEWETITGVHHSQVARIIEADLAAEPPQDAGEVSSITLDLDSDTDADTSGEAPRTAYGRLQRGLRTPEAAYYQPILKALDGLGGRARMNDVLNRVEELMRGRLSEVDYQPLNSDPEVPRWRNAAQWARNAMVKEGLLKDDSPRGIWEISDGGRHILVDR